MAELDRGLKQRIVGALVLVAMAVVFLPMLFSRPDEQRQIVVEAPPMPPMPPMPEQPLEPVEVPEPEVVPEPPQPPEPVSSPDVPAPVAAAPVPAPQPVAPAQPVVAAKPAAHLDANSLPVSWSVQLASLSNGQRAQELQQKLRSQGYNAYVRSVNGMHRVFVGPVIEKTEAARLRDQLNKQQKVSGFLVRFEP